MSKGSWYRPHDKEKFDAGWDRIFSKEEDEEAAVERCIDYEEYEEFEDESDLQRIVGETLTDLRRMEELERDEDEGC